MRRAGAQARLRAAPGPAASFHRWFALLAFLYGPADAGSSPSFSFHVACRYGTVRLRGLGRPPPRIDSAFLRRAAAFGDLFPPSTRRQGFPRSNLRLPAFLAS
jgi:hypothetical protein